VKKFVKFKPIDVTEAILLRLEKKGLIRTFRPTDKILCHASRKGLVDKIYSSPPEFGGHKLICVRSDNLVKIKLNSHPHNEEFLIVNNTSLKLKPLLVIIAFPKHKEIEQMAGRGILGNNDFITLRFRYNDFRTCVFTMLKDTVHCEISEPGRGRPSIFFVTEPASLPMRRAKTTGYTFKL